MAPSRRAVLKGLGWTTAGLVVVAGAGAAFLPRPVRPHTAAPTPDDAVAWLRLTPEGVVELIMPRSEMGQGIRTALRQIVAEETGLPLGRVRALDPRTDLLPPTRATVGSDSIRDFGPLLAAGAAALAELARQEGSELATATSEEFARLADRPRLVAADDIVSARPRSFTAPTPGGPIGRSEPDDALVSIVTGEGPIYLDDMRLPDMIFGRALHPPAPGARLEAADDSAAAELPGYLGMLEHGDSVLFAATRRGALDRAADLIRARWSGGETANMPVADAVDVDAGLRAGGLEHVVVGGDVDADGPFDIDLRLDVPMAAHAPMETRGAIARVTAEGGLEVWTSTQGVTLVQQGLAASLSLPLDQITVTSCRVGGGFGCRNGASVEVEAALLAQHLNRPVKVIWTREDEFRGSYHRPPSSHRLRVRLTPDGGIDAWRHDFRSGHVIFARPFMGPVLQFATQLAADPGVARGAVPPYAARAMHVAFDDVRLPVETGIWRALGAAPNTWAIETAIDEIARRRQEDPLALRRRLVSTDWPRLVRVLDRVAALSNWPGRRSAPDRGFGVACGVYKEMSYVAVVAELSLLESGFRVQRLWCAHDCGRIVNPGQVRAQVEGNLVWGIGMALSESLRIEGGRAVHGSYADYPVPLFSEVPDMTIDLVDEGDPPSGAGETAIIAATPAITNAIAAMQGQPVARLPADAALAMMR